MAICNQRLRLPPPPRSARGVSVAAPLMDSPGLQRIHEQLWGRNLLEPGRETVAGSLMAAAAGKAPSDPHRNEAGDRAGLVALG